MKTVLTLVGSLSANSINQRFARALEKRAAPSLRFTFADLGSLPHFNEDLWAAPPEPVIRFKQAIEAADAILFVTPEYFRAPPGLLLNALAWGGRPWGQNSWAGKPAAIVGTSPGGIGSAVAQSHLRSVLPGLELTLLGQPEVYFQTRAGLIDDTFEIVDPQSLAFIDRWIEAFAKLISHVQGSGQGSSR